MKKPETILQQKIKKHLINTFGGVWHKIHGDMYQDAGIGDLIGCLYGYYFNIEVKCPNNHKRKAHQTEEINKIENNGGCGAYVTSIEEAENVVRSYLNKKGIPVSNKSNTQSNREKKIRIMDGTGNRKNNSCIKSGYSLVEKE